MKMAILPVDERTYSNSSRDDYQHSHRHVKEKPWEKVVYTLLRGRIAQIRLVWWMALLSLGTIIYIGHRIASHRMNTLTWVKAPINSIERQCPNPPYQTLQDPSRAGKICLTTLTDEKRADVLQRLVRWRNFNNLLKITLPNKLAYVQKHGYYFFDESDSLDTTRPPSWSKIRAARRLLTEEGCQWVFWMDADTVIMQSDKRIEDFLPNDPQHDLLLTIQKGGSYNAGAWLIRNSTWSLEFLDHWWNMKEFVHPKGMSTSGDNAALKSYLLGMNKSYFDAHIVVPPRCTFNSVTIFLTPEESSVMTEQELKSKFWYKHLEFYHKGDFVAHVAGKNNKITTTQMLLEDAV